MCGRDTGGPWSPAATLCQGQCDPIPLPLKCPSSALTPGPVALPLAVPLPLKFGTDLDLPQPQDSRGRYSQLLLVQGQRETPPGKEHKAVGQHCQAQTQPGGCGQWGRGLSLPRGHRLWVQVEPDALQQPGLGARSRD